MAAWQPFCDPAGVEPSGCRLRLQTWNPSGVAFAQHIHWGQE